MARLAPTTLTQAEQAAILRATAGHVRDHAIISLALGTGLRLGQLVGLDVGDCSATDGTPRTRVHIRRNIAKAGRAGDVFLPQALLPKLEALYRFKDDRNDSLSPTAPLFCNQSGQRISNRRVQYLWREWQKKAGFDRLYPFHALRHTAITNVYKATRDLFLAQRFARHASPLTTIVYTHPSDEEIAEKVAGLIC